MRADLRDSFQLREFSAESGIIKEADGSCKFAHGDSAVLVSVYGPCQPKHSRLEMYNRATLDFEFTMPGDVRENKSLEYETVRILRSSLTHCLCLSEFPRLCILIKIVVLNHNGSLVSTSLNACILACVNAGIPMRCITVSYSNNKIIEII